MRRKKALKPNKKIKVAKVFTFFILTLLFGYTSFRLLKAKLIQPIDINLVGQSNNPIVGAIRFDAWSDRNYNWYQDGGYRRPYSNYLTPNKWHYRLPFFAKEIDTDKIEMNGDDQSVIDKEIQAASSAGLSYWAFDFNNVWWKDNKSPAVLSHTNLDYGIKRYLSSPFKNQLNFALIVLTAGHKPGTSPNEFWRNDTVPEIIKYVKEPTYQKVAGNRPLIIIYDAPRYVKDFGENARRDMDYLRAKVKEAGFNDPYIAAMGVNIATNILDENGFDAATAYSTPNADITTPDAGTPFKELMANNERFRDNAVKFDREIVPIVNVGWDRRPHWIDKEEKRTTWYLPATPAEITENLKNAITWIKDNPTHAPSNAILIYAWNEYTEGGWLGPGLKEGNARLNAVKNAISMSPSNSNQSPIPSPNPKSKNTPTISRGGYSLSADGQYWNAWVQGSNYSDTLKVQLYDNNNQIWGSQIDFNSSDATNGTFRIPSLTPPSKCNQSKHCTIKATILDPSSNSRSNQFTIKLGQTATPTNNTVTRAGVSGSDSTKYIWIQGTNLSPILKARLFKLNNQQVGQDKTLGTDFDLSGLSFRIADETIKLLCGSAPDCQAEIATVDPSGNISNKVEFKFNN